jgi:hypothetical protein
MTAVERCRSGLVSWVRPKPSGSATSTSPRRADPADPSEVLPCMRAAEGQATYPNRHFASDNDQRRVERESRLDGCSDGYVRRCGAENLRLPSHATVGSPAWSKTSTPCESGSLDRLGWSRSSAAAHADAWPGRTCRSRQARSTSTSPQLRARRWWPQPVRPASSPRGCFPGR